MWSFEPKWLKLTVYMSIKYYVKKTEVMEAKSTFSHTHNDDV